MIILPGDDGTAQLDHQPAGILELAALREGGMGLLQTPFGGHQLKSDNKSLNLIAVNRGKQSKVRS